MSTSTKARRISYVDLIHLARDYDPHVRFHDGGWMTFMDNEKMVEFGHFVLDTGQWSAITPEAGKIRIKRIDN